MAKKSTVLCPKCKFPNGGGATKCLTCKAPLPASSAVLDPPTTRLKPIASAGAVAWLCCDPLPPLPVAANGSVTVGRSPDSDLVLPHTGVSRCHTVVKVSSGELVLEDRSSNGTFLNGKRVSRSGLRVGDVLTIGPYELEVQASPARSKDEDEMAGTQPLTFTVLATGQIEQVPLSQTLQEIEFHHKTGTLKILAGDLRGSLVVRDGVPQAATLGDLRDEAAALAMLSLTEGRFTFTGTLQPGPRSMQQGITAILLELARRRDEGDR